MGGLRYLFFLLSPFLFFPLLGLAYLLPSIADLAANMLSANPMPRNVIAYHSAALIPIFTVAGIYGIKKVTKWRKRFLLSGLTVLVLYVSAIMGYLHAPFPLPGASNIWAPAAFVNLPDPRVQEIRELVGKNTLISAQANVGAHFSQTRRIFKYPARIDEAEMIILQLKSPTLNIHNYPSEQKERRRFIIGMLDNHLQMDRNDFLSSVKELLTDDEFGIAYWDNPWLVLRRGANGKEVVPEIMARVSELWAQWR